MRALLSAVVVAVVALAACDAAPAAHRGTNHRKDNEMMLPGNIGGAVPDGPDWLVRAVRDLQRDLAALRTATPAGTVRPQVFNAASDSLTLPTSYGNVESATVDVPDGYSQAIVYASMTALGYGRNNPSGNFGPTVRLLVNGISSAEIEAISGNNTSALGVASFGVLLSGATLGATVTIRAQAKDTLANMLAGAAHATLAGTVVFIR